MYTTSRTIEFKGIELEIKFTYSPAEAQIISDNDRSYAGADAEVEILSIHKDGFNVYDIYDSLDQFEEIEVAIYNEIN